MPIDIQAKTIDKRENTLTIEQHPDNCPLCHKHQEPIFITAFEPQQQYCQIVYRCTNNKCLSFFIAYYYLARDFYSRDQTYILQSSSPYNLVPIEFDEEIKKLSPAFCEIYQEAFFAEKRKLRQVAGCGYRKALEFLIKDYAIVFNPDKAENIKAEWLNKVIKEYIDDADIKACAEKATYLGNDETHYIKKWEDMDMQDLKSLIDLTKFWMLKKTKTANYLKKFSNAGKK